MSTISIAPRRRRWLTSLVVALILIAVLFTILAGFVVEVLWYNEIHQQGVFWHTLWTKVWLGFVFGLLFFLLLYVNLVIARRLRPDVMVVPNPLDPMERFRDATEPYLRWLLPLGAAVLALLVGLSVSGNWQEYLLWRNASGVSFGVPEPLFHRDPAFYVFSLPWLRFLQGWLFSSLIGVTLLVGIGHALWGAIRPQAPAFADKVTPAARAHLSVLLGLIMLVKAWGYWLGRFDLLTSKRGVVEGASYTEVKAQLPALNFLAIVAVICAVLFFANIRLKQWSLPVVAVGLLAIVSVLLGTAYPAFVQQFKVKPNEQQLELPYISYNMAATTHAFALDAIDQQQRPEVGSALTASQIRDNRTTVSNIRLWRPSALLKNFQSFQQVRDYYNFLDVDVDRYPIGPEGDPRVIMISAREINQEGIPAAAATWQNKHLAYTHGFGAVAAQVNSATTEGNPVLTLKDLPPAEGGEPPLTQPRFYYGETAQEPFVVGGTSSELDYEGAPPGIVPYSGQGGIPMGNIFKQALFAWNFRDINLLLSNQITPQSKLMIYRDVEQRAAKAVPFLTFDDDPYLAIVDGRPQWILDAYTGTSGYPYSQAVSGAAATNGLIGGTYNYIRNSVKIVVDAYDGTVTYYANLSEPIISVWNKAYPNLFTDINEAPPDLSAHFRYPENLLQIQAYQYANYHVTDPAAFYKRSDFWQISPDPTIDVAAGAPLPPMRPYYQLLKVPGATTEEFQLVLPFVPAGRPNMVAWMAASSDQPDYGKVTVFELPEGTTVEGPFQVYARINSAPEFSAQKTLLNQQGSKLTFGDLLVIPIDDSFLYVLPVYVESTQGSQIPELKRVILINGTGGDVAIGNTLTDALSKATAGSIGGGGGGNHGGNGGQTIDQQIQHLLDQALAHFDAAETALTNGDLGTYQAQIAQAQALVAQANQLAASQASGGNPTATPSPGVSVSPSPSPSPSASASASPSP
jgi:uncharacterized membrane protein (UPF0182 family)